MSKHGNDARPLTSDPSYDSFWPKPSPDQTHILFVRTPAGIHDRDYSKATTWIMNSDGGAVRQLLGLGVYGWTIQGHPEWRPNGKMVAMFGGQRTNPQIFLVRADGTAPVRLTSDGRGGPRPGSNTDPSWHPDGQSLLFVGCPIALCWPANQEIYRINADGNGEERLTQDSIPDYDPYYSPNSSGSGGTIAWLRNTGNLRFAIFRMNVDGSGQTAVIDDGGINSKPEWLPDSLKIYFHRIPPGSATDSKFNIWRVRPDGSDLHELVVPRPNYVNEHPAVVFPQRGQPDQGK